jgi:hypothetical protein
MKRWINVIMKMHWVEFFKDFVFGAWICFYCIFINCWEKVFDITDLTIADLGHMYG